MPGQVATIAYSRGLSVGSPFIRHADRWGRWSHCGIVMPGETVIEARAFHGVVETGWDRFAERATHVERVEVPVFDLWAGLSWALQQRGKGYDYLAIMGNAVRESWQEEDRWHCAELVEAFLAKCGRQRFREATWRISPNMSWSVR